MLAACAARRWLARNAAGVIKLTNHRVEAPECTSLISCLPALENVWLTLSGPLIEDDLGCLLEALAGCPRLRALDLRVDHCRETESEDIYWPFPDAAAFAKLRSLMKLALSFEEEDGFVLADIVSALTPLTGLEELGLGSGQAAVVPAALGQFKGLRSLTLHGFTPCALQAGCLDLPNLMSLDFYGCAFEEGAQMLPGVTSLQCLTHIAFSYTQGTCCFDPQLLQLIRLQHMVFSLCDLMGRRAAALGLFRLPADMGLLSSSLLDLKLSGLGLMHFPIALTQLVALRSLDASKNQFAELPAAITALSRLTGLALGRLMSRRDHLQLHETRRLDVRALGDLSGFPALCELTFSYCEVTLCHLVLGAVRHASLTLCFCLAHPAPECAQVVLQLSQALRRMRRGSVVSNTSDDRLFLDDVLEDAQGQAPCQKFTAALEACKL